jgi:BatD DUF11 like domain
MKCLAVTVTALLAGLIARAQTPIVRAKLDPDKAIIVGQPIRLTVSAFVPNYFTGSPGFPELEIENAIVVLPQDRPQNSSELIAGVTYAGITETYTIYPQQSGDYRLPPAELTVHYANAPPQGITVHLRLPSLTFHAGIPAAAADLDYFLPTTQLTIQQKWSASLKSLRAGDSVERTITVTAAKMQAMLIPPLPLAVPTGIRIYPEEPLVEDQKSDRGDFVSGRRIQSAKYFIQKGGDYTLAAIELKWWNLSANKLVTATLPAVHFTAAANPSYVAELPPEPEPPSAVPVKHVSFWTRYKFWIRIVAPCFLAFLVLIWIALRYVPPIVRILELRRRERLQSEPAYFRRLQRACRNSDAIQAYQHFLKWLAITRRGSTVDEFLREQPDTDLSSEVQFLGTSLFLPARGNRWDGNRMARLLEHHRKVATRSSEETHKLVNLNP